MFVFGPEKLKTDDNVIGAVNFESSVFTKFDFRLLKVKLLFLLGG